MTATTTRTPKGGPKRTRTHLQGAQRGVRETLRGRTIPPRRGKHVPVPWEQVNNCCLSRDDSGKKSERRGRGSDRKRPKSTSEKDEGEDPKEKRKEKDKKDKSKGCKSSSSHGSETYGEDSQGELFSDKFVIPRVRSMLVVPGGVGMVQQVYYFSIPKAPARRVRRHQSQLQRRGPHQSLVAPPGTHPGRSQRAPVVGDLEQKRHCLRALPRAHPRAHPTMTAAKPT